jgi:hypothetical protein
MHQMAETILEWPAGTSYDPLEGIMQFNWITIRRGARMPIT